MRIVAGGFLLICLIGCVSGAAISRKHELLRMKWQRDHPNSLLSKEVDTALYEKAEKEVEKEVFRDQEKLLGKGLEAVTAFSTGNILAGFLALLGLGGAGYASYRKMKGKKPVNPSQPS